MKSLAFAAALALTATAANAQSTNPLSYPQPTDGTDVFALIEIPAGSFTKYETDAKTGFVMVNRYMSMPVAYPANYGSITSSKGGDGDPLDGLIYSREPIVPGALIKVRPIGALKIIDGGDRDEKIIAVPVSKIDPTYDAIKTIDDLPSIERQRIQAFFRVYKQLPDNSKVVEVKDFMNLEETQKLIADSLATYTAESK